MIIILHFDLQPQFKYMNYFIYILHVFGRTKLVDIESRAYNEEVMHQDFFLSLVVLMYRHLSVQNVCPRNFPMH